MCICGFRVYGQINKNCTLIFYLVMLQPKHLVFCCLFWTCAKENALWYFVLNAVPYICRKTAVSVTAAAAEVNKQLRYVLYFKYNFTSVRPDGFVFNSA